MKININNCRESFESSMNQITDVLEPLQEKNYNIRMALVNARLMFVTANNVLQAYKDLKDGKEE